MRNGKYIESLHSILYSIDTGIVIADGIVRSYNGLKYMR